MAASTEEINEDCVYYQIFPSINSIKDDETTNKKLSELSEKYFTHLGLYLVQYIWQKDAFCLVVESNTKRPHLSGHTRFGDSIDDEWFIVFLLYELSLNFPDIVIRVFDNDGEFLLIEAAHFIPKWLNPDNSENRIFIYGGQLHIIPKIHQFTLPEAIIFILDHSNQTKANKEVQQAIHLRIAGYPEKIRHSFHRTHCYIPAPLAVILNQEPNLVSAAVQTFCYRDPDDLKLCRAMKFFPPETCVMAEVLFTRCLYAQLMHNTFQPDRLAGWNIPPPSHPEFKARDLGMKLASGFEILCCKFSSVRKNSHGNTDEFVVDNNWKRFFHSLQDRGYFHGELEGSKKYTRLLEAAKNFYVDIVVNKNSMSTGQRVHILLNQIEYNMEELRKAEASLSPPDDDNWLEISEEELNEMFLEASAYPRKSANLSTIPAAMTEFINKVSSLDGAEFPKTVEEKPVDFEADCFMDSMNRILDFKIPESDHDSSSGLSGYSDEDEDEFHSQKSDAQENVAFMKSYMQQMDKELAHTDTAKTFERLPSEDQGETTAGHEDFDYQPIDMDLTVLKNILESYNSQQGDPGPAGNILQAMGIPKT